MDILIAGLSVLIVLSVIGLPLVVVSLLRSMKEERSDRDKFRADLLGRLPPPKADFSLPPKWSTLPTSAKEEDEEKFYDKGFAAGLKAASRAATRIQKEVDSIPVMEPTRKVKIKTDFSDLVEAHMDEFAKAEKEKEDRDDKEIKEFADLIGLDIKSRVNKPFVSPRPDVVPFARYSDKLDTSGTARDFVKSLNVVLEENDPRNIPAIVSDVIDEVPKLLTREQEDHKDWRRAFRRLTFIKHSIGSDLPEEASRLIIRSTTKKNFFSDDKFFNDEDFDPSTMNMPELCRRFNAMKIINDKKDSLSVLEGKDDELIERVISEAKSEMDLIEAEIKVRIEKNSYDKDFLEKIAGVMDPRYYIFDKESDFEKQKRILLEKSKEFTDSYMKKVNKEIEILEKKHNGEDNEVFRDFSAINEYISNLEKEEIDTASNRRAKRDKSILNKAAENARARAAERARRAKERAEEEASTNEEEGE